MKKERYLALSSRRIPIKGNFNILPINFLTNIPYFVNNYGTLS